VFKSGQTAHDDAVASLQMLQRALRRRLLDPGLNRLALNRYAPLGHGADFSEIDAMADLLWPASDPEAEAPEFLAERVNAEQAEDFMIAKPAHSAWLALELDAIR